MSKRLRPSRTTYLDCENADCLTSLRGISDIYVLLWPGSKEKLVRYIFDQERLKKAEIVFEKDQFKMVLVRGSLLNKDSKRVQ